MSKTAYRRKAILSRIHKALNAFYLLQRIDWEYDIAESLKKILGLALEEIELDGDKLIDVLEPLDPIAGLGLRALQAQVPCDHAPQGPLDEGRLAGARHPRDHCQGAQRNAHVDRP